MNALESLKLERYRNIPVADLNDLKSLNIFVGTNNAGKTNILEFISKLDNFNYVDVRCKECAEEGGRFTGFELDGSKDENFLNGNKAKIAEIKFSRGFEADSSVIDNLQDHVDDPSKLILKGGTNWRTKHRSIYTEDKNREKLKGLSVEMIPENRFQNANTKGFVDYINRRNFHSGQLRELENFLLAADPKMQGHTLDLEFTFDTSNLSSWNIVQKDELTTGYETQGSGFQSIGAIGARAIAVDPDILLIDEPEIGLNPKARYELMDLLLHKEAQVFMATHDPTFVNPNLWTDDDVAVFVYSKAKSKFVKIKLDEDDPSSFGGFLPHTTSLKEKQIYVEGSEDVGVFQGYLKCYLKEIFGDSWLQEYNRTGIYHLGGENWRHLFHTIPPGKDRILILDGDMESTAKEIVAIDDLLDFSVVDREQLESRVKDRYSVPVYCHSKEDIADHFNHSKTQESSVHQAVNLSFEEIPEEFKEVFNSLYSDRPS